MRAGVPTGFRKAWMAAEATSDLKIEREWEMDWLSWALPLAKAREPTVAVSAVAEAMVG